MHISGVGRVVRTSHAAFCGYSHALYTDVAGGLIIGRRKDWATLYIQPGDDATTLYTALENATATLGDESAEMDVIDRILGDYDQIENWAKGNPMPSSDLMMLNYAAT